MKKIISVIAFCSILSTFVVMPVVVAAATVVQGPPAGCILQHSVNMKDGPIQKGRVVGEVSGDPVGTKTVDTVRDDWGLVCMIDKVYSVIDWIFWILLAASGIVVLMGALYIATARGNQDSVKKGKAWITAAIAGLLVAMFARFIPSIVIAIFG